jgi:hypothetical protein
MKKKKQGIPVSQRAVEQRINRALKEYDEQLRHTRSARAQFDFGDYYIVNVMKNFINEHHVDLEDKARELKVLQDYEYLALEGEN